MKKAKPREKRKRMKKKIKLFIKLFKIGQTIFFDL